MRVFITSQRFLLPFFTVWKLYPGIWNNNNIIPSVCGPVLLLSRTGAFKNRAEEMPDELLTESGEKQAVAGSVYR